MMHHFPDFDRSPLVFTGCSSSSSFVSNFKEREIGNAMIEGLKWEERVKMVRERGGEVRSGCCQVAL